MTDPDTPRPGSSAAGYRTSPVPSSPRPSVASRASRSSLRREWERQDLQAQSQSESPQPPPALDDSARPPSAAHAGQPTFAPLFALVTSNTHPTRRQTTHHPNLHYIFADDDPELLTGALARHHRDGEALDEEDGPFDRAVMLDLVPASDGAGFDVAWASSLSPDWAVGSATVSRMEGVDSALAAAHGNNPETLMLRVEGVSVAPSSAPIPPGKGSPPETELQSSGASGAKPLQQRQPAQEEYAGLLTDFESRMAVLRRVVDAGGARRRESATEADAPEGPGKEGH